MYVNYYEEYLELYLSHHVNEYQHQIILNKDEQMDQDLHLLHHESNKKKRESMSVFFSIEKIRINLHLEVFLNQLVN
jgi:hypothetical protein